MNKARPIKFRAYTEISNEVLGMKYDVPHNYNDTVMQFTGLLDKNGKEIYEGDIVKTNFGNRRVFNRLGCWFVELEKELGYYSIDTCPEVIGNIYENSELLK